MSMRVFVIILDGLGVGELPDATTYGDVGSNTLGNLSRVRNGLTLPNLMKLGLGNIIPIVGVPKSDIPLASHGKLTELSSGKDSISGHWELMGLPLSKPFPTYPMGFPEEIITEFVAKAHVPGVLCNKPASGTVVIEEFGNLHLETGKPIVYTSVDSVFQIAAHSDVIPVKELHGICRAARTILHGEHAVGRVIARPFAGELGTFQRLPQRKDFPVRPPGPTIVQILQEHGIVTTAIGKIYDLFGGIGFEKKYAVSSNAEGMAKLLELSQAQGEGLIACTLVDFDSLWGHRNDSLNFAKGLEEFDDWLSRFMHELNDADVLIITADHGCDPTTPSTDHSREYVPLLLYSKVKQPGQDLGTRATFADVAATIAHLFDVPDTGFGNSLLGEILY